MVDIVLEKGKQYKLRNGWVTTPLQITDYDSGNYIFTANIMKRSKIIYSKLYPKLPYIYNWKMNGKLVCDSIDHELDIVELKS